MDLFLSKREKYLWFWLVLLVATIYGTLGITQPAALLLRERGWLEAAFTTLFALVAVSALAHGIIRGKNLRELIVWICILVVYLMVFVRIEIPEERTHLVEYGAVALLALEAFRERFRYKVNIKNPAILAILLTTCFAIIDECIQYFMPSRVFDPFDILFNFVAAFLSVSASESLAWIRIGKK